MSRNPKWSRDELILALDLYLQINPVHTSASNPKIVELSELLNKLPIHARETSDKRFRNPQGVYMKMCNFLRLDPSYKGVGLTSGSKLDELIWKEFSEQHDLLRQTAKTIKENYGKISRPKSIEEESADQEEEFPEGRILTRTHNIRERSGSLPKRKKQAVLTATGKLECEACAFDFKEKYGDIGKGFAECHHNKPISALKAGEKTKISDLAIVCANCHRIIHKTRPWLSVAKLKEIYRSKHEL